MARRSSKPQNFARFFKLIPPPFIKKLNGNVPKTVVLKNSQGKLWEIDLEKAEDKVYMGQGWVAYVRDNSVVVGEFLVFEYNGNAGFSVRIFGKSGCQRNEASASGVQPVVKVESQARSDGLTSAITEKVSEGPCVTIKDNNTDRNIEANKIRFVKVVQKVMRIELLIPRDTMNVYNIIPPKVGFPEKVNFRGQNGFSEILTIWQRPDN